MNPLLTGLGSNLFYEMGSKRGQSENGLMGYRCMLKNVMYIYNFFQKFSPKWKPYMYNPGFFYYYYSLPCPISTAPHEIEIVPSPW